MVFSTAYSLPVDSDEIDFMKSSASCASTISAARNSASFTAQIMRAKTSSARSARPVGPMFQVLSG